jgi:peptide deformylase
VILDIVQYPSPLLREKCTPVQFRDISLEKLASDMGETMYAAPGVGLAAPQVGILKRVVVIDTERNSEHKNLLILINPVITYSEGQMVGEEGCLSLPEVYGDVQRSRVVRVRYFDVSGAEYEMTAEDFLARVVQHELDHLDGILFIDRMSKIKRDLLKMKLRKKSKLMARR